MGAFGLSTPVLELDLGQGSLLSDGNEQRAFGIDLGGGTPAPELGRQNGAALPPLAGQGTQRDGIGGHREPLSIPKPAPAPTAIPDDFDLAPELNIVRTPSSAPLIPNDPFADTVPPPAVYSSIPDPVAEAPYPTQPGKATDAKIEATNAATPPPASVADHRAAIAQLLDGAGIPELLEQALADPNFATTVGELLREAVAGLLKALGARALTKRELRVDMTMLSATENNPLKFCPNSHEALRHLLAPNMRAGYIQPMRAMRESYEDLQAHNLAVMAGMRAALLGVLQRFDPAHLEQRLESRHLLDKLVPSNRKARMWDLVAEQHANLVREAQDEFDRLFGRAFRAAYDEQVRQIRAASGTSTPSR
jgi:type VI secretion system FHA domain protein